MTLLKKFFKFIDITRKVVLNLFFLFALSFIAIIFLIEGKKEEAGSIIIFAPKKNK